MLGEATATKNLRFSVKNLGVLREGELELKPLTIITGRNNVGKTYLTYALYGFLSGWQRYTILSRMKVDALIDEGAQTIDLAPLYAGRQAAVNRACSRYKAELHTVLATDEKRMASTEFSVTIPTDETFAEHSYVSQLTTGPNRSPYIEATKVAGETELTLTALSNRVRVLPNRVDSFVQSVLKEILFEGTFPSTYIFSTERTGAATFRNELNLAKNRFMEYVGTMSAKEAPDMTSLVSAIRNSGYPTPVRDNVDFINGLEAIGKQTSPVLSEHPDLLDDFETILGGRYALDRQGNPVFEPQGAKRGIKLRMQESSSSVRSLLMFAFYLRNLAVKGDLVILDEPELNLHVENQRRLARMIARLTNIGIRFLITTHSDTIVREFNSLILLGGLGESAGLARTNSGYTADEGLGASSVNLLSLEDKEFTPAGGRRSKGVCLVPARIDSRYGIERTTFDHTIVEMDQIYNRLYAAVERLGG